MPWTPNRQTYVSQTQNFQILMDPRLEGETTSPVAEYAELNRLSATLLEAVDAMARGITELRQVKQQVDFVLEVSSDP